MSTPRRAATDPAKLAGHSEAHHGGQPSLWQPSLVYLALAMGLVVSGLVFLWNSPSLPTDVGNEGSQPAPASATVAATPPGMAGITGTPPISTRPGGVVSTPPQPAAPMAEGDADPTRDLSSYVMRGQKPTMPEVIERLNQAGIRSGLGAFSPPGTRPPLIGLAVPENFVLPDGYVRHHQATDDGQRIEAILMFAPDRQFFDAAKRPIVVPPNRVVPPEYAPPGLPIRRIVLPKPIDPAGL
jgi:hypothetical protein